jgi:hypothetical protein
MQLGTNTPMTYFVVVPLLSTGADYVARATYCLRATHFARIACFERAAGHTATMFTPAGNCP